MSVPSDTAVPIPVCPACGGSEACAVITLAAVPVFCNVLAPGVEEAKAATVGDIDLVQCATCAMIVNAGFDPERLRYSPGYENSLHHSATFQAWAGGLARRLVETYDLEGGTAVELGCGGGGFLELLCAAGISDAIGYDPSYAGASARVSGGGRIRIHTDSLRPGDALRADLAVCRHVLEHLHDPAAVVELLGSVAPSGVLYVEVPDAATMLRDGGVYDVIYEHYGYFGAPALRALLERGGLRILDVRQEFGAQYLAAEARAGDGEAPHRSADEVEALRVLAAGFAERATIALDGWAVHLDRLRRQGRDVVVWGAGSKGITFVNLVEGGAGVSRLVDLNPRKRGRFVPVTAQPVVAPEDLLTNRPDVVVVMNPLYRAEVEAALGELGIPAEVIVA